jgi:hypothetical protein
MLPTVVMIPTKVTVIGECLLYLYAHAFTFKIRECLFKHWYHIHTYRRRVEFGFVKYVGSGVN